MFKVGDLAIVINPGTPWFVNVRVRKYVGKIVRVSGEAGFGEDDESHRRREFGEIEVTPIPGGRAFDIHPKCLKPLDAESKDDAEPRSDFTPGDWDLMPWRPTKERA